ncbi:MAG: ATP-binding protein, partial [Ilumatobacteraceae bacterium]
MSTPDAERARLFGAVRTAVATLALDGPLLVVIDDLHWARRPTMELLTEVVRDQTLRRVLVVCVYRSTPADAGAALRVALPELRRLPGVTRLALGGLDRGGIEDFVEAAAGHRHDELAPAVDLLSRETDGNAFLLVELWLHLVDTGRLARRGGRWTIVAPLLGGSSPEGVQDVVAARFARLDPATREALEAAAVTGAMFDAPVVATATGRPVADVVATLDSAVASRIIDEAGGGYRFAHELIRRSIIDRLAGAQRRRLHLAVARALDTGSPGDPIAEIATHLVAAVPLVDAVDAASAAVRAADAATAAYAYDDAARFLDEAAAIGSEGRVELLLRVADAAMRAGDVVRAKERCLEAENLAQRTGDVAGRIAAALGYGEAAWRDASADPTAVQLLRAVRPLAGDGATGVRLQAALTRALALTGENDAAWVLLEDTLVSRRSLDDAYARRVAFDAMSFITWTPSTAPRQLAEMQAAADAERASGDVEWESHALSKTMYGTILTGDLDATRRIAARHRELANTIGQPLFRILDHQVHALLATGEGRFTDAEVLAEAAEELSRSMSSVAAGAYGVQLFSLRREQGRLDEARPIVEAVARLDRAGSTWRPAHTLMYAELDMPEHA